MNLYLLCDLFNFFNIVFVELFSFFFIKLLIFFYKVNIMKLWIIDFRYFIYNYRVSYFILDRL